MKTFIQAIVYLALVLMLAMFASCGPKEVEPITNTDAYTWRAEVLENNTITYVNMTYNERQVYYPKDSVWVDLATHRINDTADNTMRCVLRICKIN